MSYHNTIRKNDRGDGNPPSEKPSERKLDKRFKHNWRIDMLAIPKGHREEMEMFKMSELEKTEYLKKKSETSLKSKTSKPRLPLEEDKERLKRITELSVMSPRYYANQKKLYKSALGKKFERVMDKKIEIYKNSRYNEYGRARLKLKKTKSKASAKSAKSKTSTKSGKSGKGAKPTKPKKVKKSKEEMMKEVLEWCAKSAQPKKQHHPPKINRGKIADLEQMKDRINVISTPKHFYRRPSQTTIFNMNKISPAALAYKPTERMLELAHPHPNRLMREEPIIPGSVDPNALTYKASPRMLELAVPKSRTASKDNDVNEDAFKISPAALKYKASPRILELAKPLERD